MDAEQKNGGPVHNQGVINLDQLRELAKGTVISIPGFDGGSKIKVRVRKVDLTAELTKDGAIPNKLQSEVQQQFEQGKSRHQVEEQLKNTMDMDQVSQFLPMIDNLCKSALVEPTYEDFQEVYPLTLSQKMEIFTWTMKDVDSFRPNNKKRKRNGNANSNRQNVGGKTE